MLLARTSAECHLYIALHPCECGESRLASEHHIASRDEGLVAVYSGRCGNCGADRSFELLLDPEMPPPPPAYGGTRASAIIDAGQFLAVADREAKADHLERAIAALDEVIKHVAAGSDRIDESALWSEAGRRVYDAEPGRFRLRRLWAVRDSYQGALGRQGLVKTLVSRGRPIRLVTLSGGVVFVEVFDSARAEMVRCDELEPGDLAHGNAVDAATFDQTVAQAQAVLRRRHDRSAPPSLGPAELAFEIGLDGVAPERALGALLGLAVGDALGTTNEFRALEAPAFPRLATGPLVDIVGGGPFGVAPGQVTDDTQMAAALASRLAAGSPFSTAAMMADYRDWFEVSFDVGRQTAKAISLAADGCEARAAGRRVWDHAEGLKPAGNGSLMRAAPIGVLLARSRDARIQIALADSALTHFDPRCLLACAVFTGAIATAVRSDTNAAGIIEAAEIALEQAYSEARRTYRDLGGPIEHAFRDLEADLAAARADDPGLYQPEHHLHDTQGFVRVAFRLAFWELCHAPDFSSAVIDAANRGGDADTNAAICGALYGAVAGIDAIDPRWVRAVLEAPGVTAERRFHPRALVAALARASGRRGAWGAALAPYDEASLVIGARIRGDDRHGQYQGRWGDVPVIATSVDAPANRLEAIRAAMPPQVPGVAAMCALEVARVEGAERVVCAEARPAGQPLSALATPMSEESAIAIGRGLAALAAETHDRGGVLEGIRPEHVFAGDRGEIAVAPRAAIAARFIEGGGSLGLAYPYEATYTAPEVLRGEAATAAADVYSICATVTYLMTGAAPHESSDLMTQVAAMMRSAPADYGHAGEWLAARLRAGLSPDPRSRPAARELFS